jgi:hypothetical protein
MNMTTITVTEHEAREWSRLAQAAYNSDRNDLGHRFSMAAAVYWGKPCRADVFDTLQTIYRRWLIGGFAEVENPR